VDQKIGALSTYMGHVKIADTYWYVSAILRYFPRPSNASKVRPRPTVEEPRDASCEHAGFPGSTPAFLLRAYDSATQCQSAHGSQLSRLVRLLLMFLEKHRSKSPATLTMEDLDASAILAFLDYL